ncbi:hypothetical protein J3R83DRAFT_1201 [Lanmaoa asiatica]|nr:hypothetical protein J3R83DRAFT_1201 [Lanmaoa asiatica]
MNSLPTSHHRLTCLPNQIFRSGVDPSPDHLDPAILTVSPDTDNPSVTRAYLDLATTDFDEQNTDVSTRSTLVLLVLVEDKTIFNKSDPEPQVVMEAIAAFQFNNRKREEKGHPHLDATDHPLYQHVWNPAPPSISFLLPEG